MAVRLPELATALLARKNPKSNAPLAHLGMTSLVSGDFTANSAQQVTISPATNRYTILMFHVSYGQTPIDAFSVDLSVGGDFAFSGRLTEEDITNGHDMWGIIQQVPLNMVITNDDPSINHAVRVRFHYLVVNTKDDQAEIDRLLSAYPSLPSLAKAA